MSLNTEGRGRGKKVKLRIHPAPDYEQPPCGHTLGRADSTNQQEGGYKR